MEVMIARTSGFCGGVKRAMRLALDAAAKHGGIQSDGPLVHNRQALELLSLHGVGGSHGDGGDRPMLVRAHGVPPETREEWLRRGLRLVDATCAHVARNQRLAAEAAAGGERVVLAGDPEHAEVLAVAASAGPDCRVISQPADVDGLPNADKNLLLAQTTFNVKTFAEIAEAMRRRFSRVRVADTICRATHERQLEAERISRLVDAVVVVGGRNSANTRRLADTARAVGKPVFPVETAAELAQGDFAGFDRVGVISGASTPGWITQEVVNRLRFFGRPTPATALLRALHRLTETRILTALSASGMALAAQWLALRELRPALAAAGGCYVFFAHILNRRVPSHPEARRLSLVDSFYQNRRSGFLSVAWLAAAAALALSWREGPAIFLLFAAAFAAAVVYAWSVRRPAAIGAAPRALTHPRNWFMAAGWALILAGPPWFLAGRSGAAALAALAVFLTCLGGTVIRDLHDVASDSLLGIGTLPARLGPVWAGRLAGVALGVAFALACLPAPAALWRGEGVSAWFVFAAFLPFVPVTGLWLLDATRRGRLSDAVLLQAGVDGMGCLAGALALATGIWP